MNKHAIYHRVDSEYAYAISEKKILLKLRVAKNDLSKVKVYYVDKYKYLFNNEKVYNEKDMLCVSENDLYEYYEAEINFDMISMGYFFKLEDLKETVYYGNYKFFKDIEKKDKISYIPDFFTMPVLDKTDLFIVPSWTEEAIVYQIFPERFYRGNNYIANKNHGDWYKEVQMGVYHGGTLQGIIDKIDYLLDLGINTIYLNPIFKAGYEHKYISEDYFKIDPDFGNEDIMKKLIEIAHNNGIKIILDAVFSSSGQNHFAFQDLIKNQEKSEYKDWYKINYYPVSSEDSNSFKSFAYIPLLPKFNYESKDLQNYLLEVMKFWIKNFDIDGWRLDVGDEIPHSFWKKARKEVKTLKKDAVLVGEVWYDSRPWLNGDEFDSVMNYTFFGAVLDFIAKESKSPEEFISGISNVRSFYKKQSCKFMWNLIDSHDTSRFLYEAKGDKEKLKLGAVIQMTSMGSPTIYYGDEVGISGANDPYNRKPMLWEEKQDKDLFEFYKKIIKIRKENIVLINGETKYHFFDNKNNILGYKRYNEKEEIEIYINNSPQDYKLKINKKKKDLLTNKIYNNEILIKAKNSLILKMI